MTFKNIIEILFVRFPFLEETYLEEGDYIFDLAHPSYSIVFIPYIRKIIVNDDIENIIKVCEFLEDMANCEDKMVVELLAVSVLENIISERALIKILKKYLKAKTMELLLYLETFYEWDNEKINP